MSTEVTKHSNVDTEPPTSETVRQESWGMLRGKRVARDDFRDSK